MKSWSISLSPEDLQDYEPDTQELAQMAEAEKNEKNCPYSHRFEDLDPEDGCVYCGFYSK